MGHLRVRQLTGLKQVFELPSDPSGVDARIGNSTARTDRKFNHMKTSMALKTRRSYPAKSDVCNKIGAMKKNRLLRKVRGRRCRGRSTQPDWAGRSMGAQRLAGMSRRGEPVKSWRGRPILYSGSPIISFSWAIQPTVRAKANTPVNRFTGMPMARCTMPE